MFVISISKYSYCLTKVHVALNSFSACTISCIYTYASYYINNRHENKWIKRFAQYVFCLLKIIGVIGFFYFWHIFLVNMLNMLRKSPSQAVAWLITFNSNVLKNTKGIYSFLLWAPYEPACRCRTISLYHLDIFFCFPRKHWGFLAIVFKTSSYYGRLLPFG